MRAPNTTTLPYTTLFRSTPSALSTPSGAKHIRHANAFTAKKTAVLGCGMTALFLTHLIPAALAGLAIVLIALWIDRKSTRLNSSHRTISYAVFCLKKKKD